jgi:hypothetical protein
MGFSTRRPFSIETGRVGMPRFSPMTIAFNAIPIVMTPMPRRGRFTRQNASRNTYESISRP